MWRRDNSRIVRGPSGTPVPTFFPIKLYNLLTESKMVTPHPPLTRSPFPSRGRLELLQNFALWKLFFFCIVFNFEVREVIFHSFFRCRSLCLAAVDDICHLIDCWRHHIENSINCANLFALIYIYNTSVAVLDDDESNRIDCNTCACAAGEGNLGCPSVFVLGLSLLIRTYLLKLE